MPTLVIETVGRRTNDILAMFGDFFTFAGQTIVWLFATVFRKKTWQLVMPQMYDVGVKSIPVISVTGAFIGMVLAIESYTQFKAIGQEERIGSIINLSVVKQIGPVLAAMMLAGRIGGALTAELGTMNVTEQLDALRVMGADPIGYLVVPRLIACLLLTPILTIYSDMLGVLGGYIVTVKGMGVPAAPYWAYSDHAIDTWQVMEGIWKSIVFGGAIGLISCYKGFTCGSGASGVGRACTESFVTSFIVVMITNFFMAKLLKDLYEQIYGIRSLF
ncbi:MAG: MlaE family ABC transporter permease [Tepidisphaeraceae bacterium]